MMCGRKTLNSSCTVGILLWFSLLTTPVESLACVTNSFPEVSQDRAWTLPRLLEILPEGMRQEEAFEEMFTSPLLTNPVHKVGTLRFSPPFSLEKHVTFPFEERFRADEDRLYYENPDQGISSSFSLNDFPSLSAFIQGLRALLNGDLELIQRHFQTKMGGDAQAWTLTLRPMNTDRAQGVECIQFQGKSRRIHVIHVLDRNGDSSRMVISLVDKS